MADSFTLTVRSCPYTNSHDASCVLLDEHDSSTPSPFRLIYSNLLMQNQDTGWHERQIGSFSRKRVTEIFKALFIARGKKLPED